MAETLTDSLLDDLDDLSDVEEEQEEQEEQKVADDEASSSDPSSTTLPQRKRLIDDFKLQNHLESIRQAMETNNIDAKNEGQYQLMTASNKFLIAAQNELHTAHSELINSYSPKFPELEDLLPNPIAYKNAIKVIQNEMDLTLVTDRLEEEAKLSPNQIITLSVASSTTQGEALNDAQLEHVNDCIEHIEQIIDIQNQLISFVEKHMENLAPNVCTLIGATLAARMVATAGGMSELSKIPSCNLQVLGQVKATSASRAGMSTSISAATAASNGSAMKGYKPHEGMLSESDLYRRVPGHLQRKALKVIAAKLALAIRCDYVNLEAGRKRNNESGKKFRAEIEKKFAKLEEPDLAPVVKALPKMCIHKNA
ncbi:hypothetical protein CTEN210_10565 [Chaetoceros tenuissimus]|uniref:Nop domain-containing protein n=1 Tax=Chaetoceros tenuissimus TaxID=426638 RepID=A0AAD3CZW9_9STRA|nr:hypothetical protein CTEN210_10565 [Chaetoceros tenuissimus]